MMRFFAGQTPLIIYEFVYLPPLPAEVAGRKGGRLLARWARPSAIRSQMPSSIW